MFAITSRTTFFCHLSLSHHLFPLSALIICFPRSSSLGFHPHPVAMGMGGTITTDVGATIFGDPGDHGERGDTRSRAGGLGRRGSTQGGAAWAAGLVCGFGAMLVPGMEVQDPTDAPNSTNSKGSKVMYFFENSPSLEKLFFLHPTARDRTGRWCLAPELVPGRSSRPELRGIHTEVERFPGSFGVAMRMLKECVFFMHQSHQSRPKARL